MTVLEDASVASKPRSAETGPAATHQPGQWASGDTVRGDHHNRFPPAVEIANLDLFYAKHQALHGIDLQIPEKQVTAFIGPSGCGKSTLLRCINRMNDLIDTCTIKGSIKIHGREIYVPRLDVIGLRKRIGMVFQKANPFPKSIYENVIYSLRIDGVKK